VQTTSALSNIHVFFVQVRQALNNLLAPVSNFEYKQKYIHISGLRYKHISYFHSI
jgi:hypothetical protein